MSDQVIFVDTYRIRDGKVDEFRQATDEIVEFVTANEPRLIAYGVYINDEGTEATGFQIHPDSESIEHHFAVAGPKFGPIMEFIEVAKIDVYGKPSDRVLEHMMQMAKSFGSVQVSVKNLHAGFIRHQAE
jgi:hypothetical protein